VQFIAANTDFQVLERNLSPTKVQLGTNLTKGLGAGGNPEIGAKATHDDIDKVRESIQGSDMVFLTAGLGGGTGTGGAPIIAQVAKELGALTVAVVTKPFSFEGKVRQRKADEGLKALEEAVDTLIIIPNDRLIGLADRRATFLEMLKRADDVLFQAVKGISDLIVNPGLINVDFADVKTVMNEMGLALMGTGMGQGENRAAMAAQQAISSPLLEDISIHGARAALINLCAGPDLGMHEFEEASSVITKELHEDAQIILGTTIDPNMEDELRVTVIATGIGKAEQQQPQRIDFDSRLRTTRRAVRTQGIIPELNYDYLEGPPAVRHPATGRAETSEVEQPRKKTFLRKLTRVAPDDEDLNIPTFIRRQAD
jgi:cell division protein FtsZ